MFITFFLLFDFFFSTFLHFCKSIFLRDDDLCRVVRKRDYYLSENKGAYQLRSNWEADQRLCFRYTDSTILLHFNVLACFSDCTGRFVSDLTGIPEDRFSRVPAHFIVDLADGSRLMFTPLNSSFA